MLQNPASRCWYSGLNPQLLKNDPPVGQGSDEFLHRFGLLPDQGGNDKDLVGIARGDSETWRSLPDAIVAQTGFEVNRLRLLVGEKSLLGAIVMGDQKLSFPLQKIISANADISTIRDRLLQSGAPIADIIADYWTAWRPQYAS